MDQHNSSLLGNLILGAVALILFGAIFWAANYFLNSPKLSQKPAATATPLPSASGDIKGAEKELTEIPFEDAASGEKKEINGIKINQEVSIGDLPKGVEVGPLKPGENVADTGFYIRKDGNDIVNSEGGHYDGYTVSGIGNIVYIMVSLSNTGTGGDFQDQYVFVYDKSDGSLKQLNDDRITFTGSDPLIINYKNHLYIKAAYTSHTSHDPADALQGFSLLVLDDKGAKTDDRSLESRKGSWNADASLVERDNKLYIRVKNNYYYAIEGKNEQTDEDIPLHAGAADEYYLLGDNGKMIASSADFKDQYLKNALTYDGGIKNDAGGKDWLSPLLARTMNYILAGEEEKAWEDFDADFSRLNSKYPLESSADPGKIREDVSKISDGAKGIDGATGWKIYKSDKYGFQFEYPPQFTKDPSCTIQEAEHSAEGGLVYIGNHAAISINDANGLSLENYVDKDLNESYSGTDNITKDPAYVGNEKGLKVNYRAKGTGRYGETTYILKDGKIYSFSYIAGGDCTGESGISELSVLGDVLASFSFTGQVSDSTDSGEEDSSGSSLMIINNVIPKGVPKIYGQELGVSFDNIQGSMNMMKVYDQSSYGNGTIKLAGDKLKRYTSIGKKIACEFCCLAKTLVFDDGKPACACAHSQAMRGLMAYLIDKHGSEYTDDEILREITRWKVAYFPKAMVDKIVKEVNSGQYDSDVAALLKDIDKDKLKEAVQGFQIDKQNLPSQQGNC